MRSGAVVIAAATALLGAAAAAQPAPADPIGALLQRPAQSAPEEEEPAAPAPPAEVRPYVAPPEPISDLAYESRIRASMASAQGFQGPLDGSWTLAAADGALYAFQLVDRGDGVVDGAWRDLRRTGALGASGFFDLVERLGSEVVLRFDGQHVATLRTSGDGRWTGDLDEAGQRRPVSLTRNTP